MIVVPKRKLETGMPGGENFGTIVNHTEERVITEIRDGYGAISKTGNFTWELQIPSGIDKYPGGHGA